MKLSWSRNSGDHQTISTALKRDPAHELGIVRYHTILGALNSAGTHYHEIYGESIVKQSCTLQLA